MLESLLRNPILAFIVLVGLVVFVHELGHYIVGKLCGVEAEEFSIGFGPKAFSFKKFGTEFKVCWLPLGGYVRFYGADIREEIPGHLRHKSILTTKLPYRFLIGAAGPFANFLLSLFLMIILSFVGIPKNPAVVSPLQNSVAERAGIESGDIILSMDGKKIANWQDLHDTISRNADKNIKLVVQRNQQEKEINLTPQGEDIVSPLGETIRVGRVGVSPVLSTPRLVVPADSVLFQKGFRTGDKVTSINEIKIKYFHEIIKTLQESNGAVKIGVKRPHSQDLNALIWSLQNEPTDKPFPSVTLEGNGSELLQGFKNVTSTDMLLAPPNKKEKDKSASAKEAWKACGLEPGVTLLNVASSQNAGSLNQLTRSPLDISHTLETLRKDFTSAKDLTSVDKPPHLPLVMRTLTWSGKEEQKQCELTLVQERDQLNQWQWTIDFPFSFVTPGLMPDPLIVKSDSFFSALKQGAEETWIQFTSIGDALKKLVMGKLPLANLGGPIAIAKVAGHAAESGWLVFFLTVSWMSMNIGLFNLVPLPALDGGTLVLVLLEGVYGKPLPKRFVEGYQRLGFLIILTLIILVFYNDFLRVFK